MQNCITNDYTQGISITGVCNGENFKYIIVFDKIECPSDLIGSTKYFPSDLRKTRLAITPLLNHKYTSVISEQLTTFSWYYPT